MRVAVVEEINKSVTPGGDNGNQWTSGNPDIVRIATVDECGNSQSYAQRRLMHERPDLYSRVVAKERLCNAVGTQEAREALALLEQVTQQGRGGDHGNQYTKASGNVDNVHIATERPSGNTKARALRQLRTNRPDLHDQVVAGAILLV